MKINQPGAHLDHLLRQTRMHHVELSSMALTGRRCVSFTLWARSSPGKNIDSCGWRIWRFSRASSAVSCWLCSRQCSV